MYKILTSRPTNRIFLKRPSLKTSRISLFGNHKQLFDSAIQKWIEIARDAIREKGFFTVALSGGKTPVPFYRRLSLLKNNPLWKKTHIFLVDERFVAPGHAYNNFRALSRNLLNRVAVSQSNIHSIATDVENEKVSAKGYEKDLKIFFRLPKGRFPRFDLILLGIGGDGHTASLFPGDKALKEERRLVVSVARDDVKYRRITLTLPVLNSAKNILFIMTGKEKLKIIAKILKGDRRLPSALVKPCKGKVFFFLDRRSAESLKKRMEEQ